jgi:hypothetical protein
MASSGGQSHLVEAGYYQFYLEDADADPNAGDPIADPNFRQVRIGCAPGRIAVAAGTYGEVNVEVELMDAGPSPVLDGWDHVVEASLHVPSGRIQLLGCPDPDPVAEWLATPGTYRVRVHFGNLGQSQEAIENGLAEELEQDEDDEGDGVSPALDHYRLLIWAEPESALLVLKSWPLQARLAAPPAHQEPTEMNESAWDAGRDLWKMIESVSQLPDPKPARRFACACVRRVWSNLVDERSTAAVEIAERYLEGQCTEEELHAAWSAACAADQELDKKNKRRRKKTPGVDLEPDSGASYAASLASLDDASLGMNLVPLCSAIHRSTPEGCEREAVVQAMIALLQEHFGNPFRE